jgi:hypothetical protein
MTYPADTSAPKKPWEPGYTRAPTAPITPTTPSESATSTKLATTNIIDRAARFLQHESVCNASSEAKRHFLQQKGLSSDQIDLALRRAAEISSTPADSPSSQATLPGTPVEVLTNESASSSFWTRRALPMLGGIVGAAAGGMFIAAMLKQLDGYDEPTRAEQSEAASSSSSTDVECSSSNSETVGMRTGCTLSPHAQSAVEELRAMRQNGRIELVSFQSVPLPSGVTEAEAQAVIQALTNFECECVAHSRRAELLRALNTLLMLLSSQLRRPTDLRYHRLNRENDSLRELLALPGSGMALAALGFIDGGGSYWVWRGCEGQQQEHEQVGEVAGRLPNNEELCVIRYCKELLAARLEKSREQTGGAQHQS